MDFLLKQTKALANTKTDCLVIPVFDQKTPCSITQELDQLCAGRASALLKSHDIDLSKGKVTIIHQPENSQIPRVLFVGCGKKLDYAAFRTVFKTLARELVSMKISQAHIVFDDIHIEDVGASQLLQQATCLLQSQTYQYDTTLSKKAPKISLNKISYFCTEISANQKKAIAQGLAMANGIMLAKHLGNLPANICTPSFLAQQATLLAKQHNNIHTKILNETDLKKLKMFSLLSVTAGTDEPAKFIIMEYKGGKSSEKPYVLVGKGVTFDSGGISLKPGPKMDEMKYDMCGAASVLGTIQAVAELELKINLVVVIPAVENLPSGKATKPGDVITSMSGQTIEVLNTDAEGRLILCDALTYVERFKPQAVIDVATLTGACIVALGKHASGLYSNNDNLSKQLVDAGNATYDRAWPMPLWDEYNQQLSSKFADIGNIGGPEGGSVTAACFLSRFTKQYHWAHLDIAGPAWDVAGEKGASGRPVSLLTQYLIDRS
jgi:leucyl aminopeptidase